jgi:hypothetical protein
LQSRLRRGIRRRRELRLHRLDLTGHRADEELARTRVLRLPRQDHLACELVTDDLHLGAVDLIAVRVVEVIVGVDDIADWLRRDRLQLFAKRPRAARRDVRVDDEHVAIALDNRGIRHDHQAAGADRVIDAVRDPVERERRTLIVRARRTSGARLRLRRHRRDRRQADGKNRGKHDGPAVSQPHVTLNSRSDRVCGTAGPEIAFR